MSGLKRIKFGIISNTMACHANTSCITSPPGRRANGRQAQMNKEVEVAMLKDGKEVPSVQPAHQLMQRRWTTAPPL